MLSSILIVSASQILLFTKYSYDVLRTRGSSSKMTDAFSPGSANAALGNTLPIVSKEG